MTKYSFLNELDQLLSDLPLEERREILEDYEEHFAFAKRADKSDADIIALVGSPVEIAKEILEQQQEQGDQYVDAFKAYKQEEKALNEQAAALEEQAAALEAKLAEQAEALAKQAEALAKQTEVHETHDGSFGSQVGSFVDSITATVGSMMENVSEIIVEDSENLPENAIQSETLIEEIVDMTGVKNVVINSRNQKVAIESTIDSAAKVRLAKGMLAVKVEGDTLYIESRALKRKFAFGGFTMEQSSSGLSVELPEKVYQLIQAKTVNAKIEIESFEVDRLELESNNGKLEVTGIQGKELKLKTGNGSIQVEDSRGNLLAQTTNGGVHLEDFDGKVDIKTSNGKIALESITGDIEAKTSNGRIEFENGTINQNVKLTTSNAAIQVELDQKPEHATFELSTSNAKTSLFETDRNYDVFGEGTYQVKLSTSNGRIEVEA